MLDPITGWQHDGDVAAIDPRDHSAKQMRDHAFSVPFKAAQGSRLDVKRHARCSSLDRFQGLLRARW